MKKQTMKTEMNHPPAKQRSAVLLAVSLSTLTFAVAAHAAISTVGAGESGFLAVGPAGLKIEGTGTGVIASETDGKITVKAPITNLKTGISLRDNHLKDAIHAEKNPHATLVVARSALKFPEAGKSVEESASGAFTLNGVTKTVPFKYKAENKGGQYEVQGNTEIIITDYKIEQPCYLGVCVDTKVKVKVKFKAKD
jgi:polyisoprenoid-binding protein YceI